MPHPVNHPAPWAITTTAGYASVHDAEGNLVGPFIDLEMGWTDTSTGNYHSPAADVQILQRVVNAVNAQAEIETAFIAMGRAGANADMKHPLRKAWEACRAIATPH